MMDAAQIILVDMPESAREFLTIYIAVPIGVLLLAHFLIDWEGD